MHSSSAASDSNLHQLRQSLKLIRIELAQASAELESLNEDLVEFEQLYEAQVGHLLTKLLLVEKEVAHYLERIQALRDAQQFGSGYRSAEAQFREKWQHIPEEPVQGKPTFNPQVESNQIKKLYRQLARHYHPDLAGDEDEKLIRNKKMAAINDAYSAGSVIELMALTEDLDSDVSNKLFNNLDNQTEQTMAQALQQELSWSRKRLRQIKQEIQNFHLRPIVDFALEVKLANREGRDLMADMAAELERQIGKKSAEAEMLKTQFQNL